MCCQQESDTQNVKRSGQLLVTSVLPIYEQIIWVLFSLAGTVFLHRGVSIILESD